MVAESGRGIENVDETQDYCDNGGFYMDKKKMERLYELLERVEREHDREAAAALRWAIFNLERMGDTG